MVAAACQVVAAAYHPLAASPPLVAEGASAACHLVVASALVEASLRVEVASAQEGASSVAVEEGAASDRRVRCPKYGISRRIKNQRTELSLSKTSFGPTLW